MTSFSPLNVYMSAAARGKFLRVCTENLIRVGAVMESPKLAE
jgi:hypothetical protein